jgi:hypothetical protein
MSPQNDFAPNDDTRYACTNPLDNFKASEHVDGTTFSGEEMATAYATDIRPKFRPQDVACMTPRHILIGDQGWMCGAAASFGYPDHGNARHVFDQLSGGTMPPDGAWSQAWLDTYSAWMAEGFQP